MEKHIYIGKLGEEIASMFLMKQGYKIIQRNYLRKWGELDIICSYGKILVFIEVKSVSCESINNVIHETNTYKPEDNVHKYKQDRLKRAIQTYLAETGTGEVEWTFTIATVFIDSIKKQAGIRLIEDVVL